MLLMDSQAVTTPNGVPLLVTSTQQKGDWGVNGKKAESRERKADSLTVVRHDPQTEH